MRTARPKVVRGKAPSHGCTTSGIRCRVRREGRERRRGERGCLGGITRPTVSLSALAEDSANKTEKEDVSNVEQSSSSNSNETLLVNSLKRGEPCSFDRDSIILPEEDADKASEWQRETSGYLKQILSARVYDVAQESELQKATGLSSGLKNTVFLKREDTQKVFSFKLRGAFNKMASLSPEDLSKGVICSSAGNHAQGVALSAKRLGCEATICMPIITPDIKVEAVKRLGGKVKLVGENYDECQSYAIRTSQEKGLTYIHPFDDPYVIAGQGTVGVEILRQCSIDFVKQDRGLDAIFVPVGGGGLLAGVATFIKQVRPDIKVFGVEPLGAACMTEALMRGEICTLDTIDAFAEGVAVKTAGKETFRLISKYCDGIITVTTEEICAAIKDVFNDTRSILEPAGAVSVAGLKSYCKLHGVKDNVLVAISSGANMNFDRLRFVSQLADYGNDTVVSPESFSTDPSHDPWTADYHSSMQGIYW